MSFIPRTVVSFVALLLVGQAFVAYGQVGRATLTGVVTDPTGSVVAHAAVTATNIHTGGTYPGTTNEVGTYTIGALPVGEYSVRVGLQGFKEFVQSGIRLSADQVARLDVRLEVGSTAEAIEVRADVQMLMTESASTSTNVDTRAFSSLPLTFAEGRNMAVFAEKLIPGWRGSRHDSSVHGTPAGGQTVLIDGQNNLTGFLSGDFAEQSISPEAIQEMTVTVGAQSAETGRASGGVLQFALKSGTNQLHGSGLFQLRNEVLNANQWGRNLLYYSDPIKNADKARDRERRFNYAGSVGGPVYLPKIYDGRNKTFFHLTFEKFRYSINGATGNWNRTVPLPEFRQGDFSSILGPVKGTDVLGRDVAEGAIFDPSTLRQVNNVWVMDPFVGNRIPVSRFSEVAKSMIAIYDKYYNPMRDQMSNNYLQSAYWRQSVRQGTIKGDHYFSPSHKLSGYYNWMAQPRTTSDQGLWTPLDWETGGPYSAYIKQNRNGYNVSLAYDWTVSPTVLNSFRYGYNNGKNFYGSFNQNYDGKPIEEVWGLKGLVRNPDIPPGEGPIPFVQFGGSHRWTPTNLGHRSAGQKDYTNTIISDTLNWHRGKHLFKFGFELNSMHQMMEDYSWWGLQMVFNGRSTSQPLATNIVTGHSWASFLLGAVNSASMAQPLTVYPNMYYLAGFAQDTWKVTPRLTLTLGLRWNGSSPIYERDDKQANFNRDLIDPASGLPGAVEYMGSGSGRSGKRTPIPGSWRMFGPTFGFAYSITDRVVARGGYSLTYEPMSFRFTVVPFNSPLQGRMNAAQDSQGPYRESYNLDNGFPNMGWSSVDYSPSWANIRGNTPTWVSPDFTRSGYSQHMSFGFQTAVTSDLMVETDWRFTKGTRLNGQSMVLPNQVRIEDLRRFTPAVLDATYATPEAAVAVGLPYTFPGWSGRGYEALRPYPQLGQNGINAFGARVGFSTYHSGNLVVTKRMSSGVYAYGAYTFSKTITNVTSVDGANTGFTDTYNLSLYKSIGPDDRTHVLKSAFVWELPVGRGRHFLGSAGGVLDHLVSGWTVSATIGYSSGTPLGTVGGLGGVTGWNGAGRVQDFNTPAGGFKRLFNPDTFDPWNPNAPGNVFFDTSAFSTPGPQDLGSAPRRFPQIRMPWRFSEDASLVKRFTVHEGVRLEFRLEMLNLFNRHYFSTPQMSASHAAFGKMQGIDGSADPRKGQAGLRIEW